MGILYMPSRTGHNVGEAGARVAEVADEVDARGWYARIAIGDVLTIIVLA